DALASHGLCAAALLGVWLFKGKNGLGGVTLLADLDCIAFNNGREVYVVYDSDVVRKAPVRTALERLLEHLRRKGVKPRAVYLPEGRDGTKCGVDDFLLGHAVADLEALIERPRPVPTPAKPTVELLPAAPVVLDRPLAGVGDHAYAVTWLWVR